MNFWWLFTLAVSLAMDCFAVSLGIGSSPLSITFRRVSRIAFHFGFFQFAMSCLGWLLGSSVVNFISGFDHWLAFALLAWVGIHMIHEGLSGERQVVESEDPTRGRTLIMLSLATSIDSLGVGLSLALLQINIFTASLLIGLVSLVFSAVGMRLGNSLSEKFGERMEIAGGILLLLIGLRILVTHLMG